MNDWACHKCDGLGMVPGDPKWWWCDCPTGKSKRRWQNMSPEEQRREKSKSERKKKKPQDDESIPHWVKE